MDINAIIENSVNSNTEYDLTNGYCAMIISYKTDTIENQLSSLDIRNHEIGIKKHSHAVNVPCIYITIQNGFVVNTLWRIGKARTIVAAAYRLTVVTGTSFAKLIFLGRRHGDFLMEAAVVKFGSNHPEHQGAIDGQLVEQGFIDSLGRFNSRFESFHIAKANGQNMQIPEGHRNTQEVYSEWLWE